MSIHCCAEHGKRESFYDRYISRWLLHGACSLPPIHEQREKIVPLAEGVVVELGMGTGLNLPHYDTQKVSRVIGVDPVMSLMELAEKAAHSVPFVVDLHIESAEAMPLEDNSADTVVVTYSFCTIPDEAAALKEVRRVLKPGGRVLFSEHGISDNPRTAKWQHRITPIWKRLAGGCHLNRNIERLLLSQGFELVSLEKLPMPGVPGVLGFNYRGCARPV